MTCWKQGVKENPDIPSGMLCYSCHKKFKRILKLEV